MSVSFQLPSTTAVDSTDTLLSMLVDGGRLLLTLSVSLFLSYLVLVGGALLLAQLLPRRMRAAVSPPSASTLPHYAVATQPALRVLHTRASSHSVAMPQAVELSGAQARTTA